VNLLARLRDRILPGWFPSAHQEAIAKWQREIEAQYRTLRLEADVLQRQRDTAQKKEAPPDAA
jgi:hypothetical protein